MASGQPVIWWSLRCFTLLCGALGHDTAVKLGGRVGKLIGFFSFSRKAKARSRAARMLGVSDERAREIISDAYEHFGRALVEFIRLPRTYGNIDEFVAVKGEENIRKALNVGHGAIFLSAHIGCWEYGAAVLAKHGVPMNALGAEQRDERITRAITDMRSSVGVKPVGKGMDLRAALTCLKKNEVLAILLDQNAKNGGILSPFLGHLASTHFGIIKIAHKYGIPVVPVHITRDGDGRRMTMIIETPLEGRDGRPFGEDIKYAVDKCNERISEWIREKPGQWMWMYPRWVSTLNDR
jgi:KDO2-lipid IV(A) lauroyltransferase